MPLTADAVIIGGGAVGTSILYHLAQFGMRNLILLEKDGLSAGSTGDSAAIIRQHYSNPVSIQLAMRSIEILKSFPEKLGQDVFDQTGWVFLVPEDAGDSFKINLKQLQELGVNTREISIDEVPEHIPGLNPDGIAHVAFEPDGGYCDPQQLCVGFANGAQSKGAQILLNTPATGISISNNRVTGVTTSAGHISTPIVVNSAGPWAHQVGRWAGLDLPLEISREQEIMVRVKPGMPLPKTAVSNMVDRIYFRPTREQGTLLVGVGHPKDNESADPDNYNRKADAEFAKDTVERLTRRLPHMVGADLIASWAGLYTITPDWNMIADQAAGVDGLFLAVGGSGHSFKLAPALGECMAELIASGESNTVDITPLRASRFEEGGGMLSTYGGNRG